MRSQMCCAFGVLDQPIFWERNLLERAPECSVVCVWARAKDGVNSSDLSGKAQ